MILIICSVESLRRLEDNISRGQDSSLRHLMNIIISSQKDGRRLNAESLSAARGMYKKITKNMSKSQIKKWLRQNVAGNEGLQNPDITVGEEQASVVEEELKTALNQQKSALYDRPYVEKMGRNDFLVMKPDVMDPFVTVIPNAIYYNIEKKCVNWLDDCSLKGIRARLLRGVHSP